MDGLLHRGRLDRRCRVEAHEGDHVPSFARSKLQLQAPGGKSSEQPHVSLLLQQGTKYGMQPGHDVALHVEPPPPLSRPGAAKHAFDWHVRPADVQSWHATPPLPHSPSSLPRTQVPVESQQPFVHVSAHEAPASSPPLASSPTVASSSPTGMTKFPSSPVMGALPSSVTTPSSPVTTPSSPELLPGGGVSPDDAPLLETVPESCPFDAPPASINEVSPSPARAQAPTRTTLASNPPHQDGSDTP
jgi:hypothetical protein